MAELSRARALGSCQFLLHSCLYRRYFRQARVTIFHPFPLRKKCLVAAFTFREMSWAARSCFVHVCTCRNGTARGWGLWTWLLLSTECFRNQIAFWCLQLMLCKAEVLDTPRSSYSCMGSTEETLLKISYEVVPVQQPNSKRQKRRFISAQRSLGYLCLG